MRAWQVTKTACSLAIFYLVGRYYVIVRGDGLTHAVHMCLLLPTTITHIALLHYFTVVLLQYDTVRCSERCYSQQHYYSSYLYHARLNVGPSAAIHTHFTARPAV